MTDRIYITGASCAGATTLGAALARRLVLPQLDTDDFYWMSGDPPFREKRPVAERVRRIGEAQGKGGWILTGSCDGWGDALLEAVGLVIFVDTPAPIRMERLATREAERYGARILPGGDMYDQHLAFRDWASRYEDPGFAGRNRARHEAWLAAHGAPVLLLDGTRPVEEMVARVLARLEDPS